MSRRERRARRRRPTDRFRNAAAEVLEVRETLSATVVSADGRATLVVDESRREITIRFANLNRNGSPQTQFDVATSASGQWTVRFDDLLNNEKTTVWFRGSQQIERDASQRFPSSSINISLPGEISARVTGSNGTTLMQPVVRLQAPVNRAPAEITISDSTVIENSPTGTVIGTLSARDPDGGDTHTFTLLDDAGGRFRVVGSQIQVANDALLDYEVARSHSIRVRATDRGGLFVERVLPITVTNLNEAPTDIRLSSQTVEEGARIGTEVGILSAVDPDVEDRWKFQLLDDADGRFALDGNRMLVADAGRIDYEAMKEHVIRLRATDARGATVERSLTVNVSDIADSHLQTLPSRDGRSVALINWATRTVTLHYVNLATSGREDVHFDLDLKDSTAAGWTLRYDDLLNTAKTVTWAKDGDVIGVDKNQRSPSQVTKLAHGSRVSAKVSGAVGKVLMRAFLHVVNHAPAAIQLSHNTIPEHYPSGAVVGRLSVTDQDTGDRHNLTLIDDAAGRFRLDGERLFVADAAGLDFETSPSYRISVRATDLRGGTRDETFTIQLVDIDDQFMEIVTSRDGRARLLIDHSTQTVTIHYLNANSKGAPEVIFDVSSLSSSGWTFQFDDLINSRKTVTWYRNGAQLREVKSDRFPQVKTVPNAGGRLSAVIQGEAGRKLMHAVLNFKQVQEVRRDPVIVVMTHGWTSWLQDTPSDWIPEMARAMAAMTNRLGIDKLDPNVKPVRLDAIENASGPDALLNLWKGSPQFLALNWTQQSNNGTAAAWDINEVTHRRSIQRSAKALFRMIRARVNEYTATDAAVKVDLLIVGHSFGTSVNRDLVDLLEDSDFVDKLDLTKVVELDPVALKAKNASTHDQFYWKNPELSPVVDRVTSYYQTKGLLAGFLERQLIMGRPLDGYGADAGDTKRSGGAPLGFFNSQGRIFDVGTGTELQRFRHLRPDGALSPGELTAVDYSRNGRYLASSSRDGSVEIRDAISLQVVSVLRGHRGDIRDAVFSPDGSLVATVGQDETVRVWRVADGTQVWQGQHSGVTDVVWNSSGTQFASAGNDGRIKVFGSGASAPGTFRQLAVVVVSDGEGIRGLAFAGDQLLTGGLDGSLRVWNLSPAGLVQSQRIKFDRSIRSLVTTPDGAFCAVATGRGVSLLSRQANGSYVLQQETTLHHARVGALAISSDGRFLASGGDDGRILIYELQSLRLEREISTPMLPVRELDFNGNGNEIAAVFRNQEGGPVNDINVTENLEARIEPSFWETFKKWFDRGVDVLKDVFDGDGYWDVAFDVAKIAAEEFIDEAKTRIKYHVTVPFVYIDDVLRKNGEAFFSVRDNPGALRYNEFVPRTVRMEDETPVVSLSLDLPAENNEQSGVGSSLIEMTLSEPVTGFDLMDFQLQRDGANVDLTGARLEQLSETQFRLDLSSATGQAGEYLLTLSSASSEIANSAGELLSADWSLLFEIAAKPVIPEPGQTRLSDDSVGLPLAEFVPEVPGTEFGVEETVTTDPLAFLDPERPTSQITFGAFEDSKILRETSVQNLEAAYQDAGAKSRLLLVAIRQRQPTTRDTSVARSMNQPLSLSGANENQNTANSQLELDQLASLALSEVAAEIDAVFATWDGL